MWPLFSSFTRFPSRRRRTLSKRWRFWMLSTAWNEKMTAFFRENAIASQSLRMRCRRICWLAMAESKNAAAYLQKSTAPKHCFYPTIITQGQMPTTDLVYTFYAQYRSGQGCLSLNCGQCGVIQHERKGYVFSLASIAFCPQRQLVRAYP